MMPPEEIVGNIAGEALRKLGMQLQAEKVKMSMLLRNAGDRGVCKGCGAAVIYLCHARTGKRVPYSLDGVNHFATCPEAEQFRKKAAKQNG